MIRSAFHALPLAVVMCVAALGASAQGRACARLTEPRIVVDSQLAPLEHDYTKPIAALNSLSGRSAVTTAGRPQRVLGLAWVRYGSADHASVAMVRQTDGSVCAAPAEVRVTLRLEERRVYVASELPEGTCIHGEVLSHELRHVKTDEALVSAFMPRVEMRLRSELHRIGTFRAGTPDEARNRVLGALNGMMQGLLRDFGAQRSALQARIDTRLEYRRVSVSCGGELAKYLHTGDGTL